MILLLLLIYIVLCVCGIVVCKKDTHIAQGYYPVKETGGLGIAGMVVFTVSGVTSFILIGVLLISLFDLANTRSYDAEIAVIQEQNSVLEDNVNSCVSVYLEHEGKTYDAMTADKAIAYAIALPELSSNVLVQEQISIYKENRATLQNLLLKKAKVSALRYKVYFCK